MEKAKTSIKDLKEHAKYGPYQSQVISYFHSMEAMADEALKQITGEKV